MFFLLVDSNGIHVSIKLQTGQEMLKMEAYGCPVVVVECKSLLDLFSTSI